MDMKARFRPKADANALSRLIQEAWQFEQAKLTDQMEALGVCEAVATFLEARFPAADMAVLARYGVAKEITEIGVRAYSPETKRWDETVSVKLPRAILTPGHYGLSETYQCGPRWSREENRGLKPEYRATLTAEKWEAYCADQDLRERRSLPESVDPFFDAVVSMRKAYQAEYRQASDWPVRYKADHGVYPTWAQIAAQFPVLGAHIARQA